MIKYFILITILISEISTAQINCSNKVLGLQREIPLEATPTYFIRVDTNTNKIFLSGECTLSLETGKCISTGRTWEPYPISGSDLLVIPHCNTHPSQKSNESMSMCFYSQKNYKNMADSVPIYKDKELFGYYQSVGVLNKNKEDTKVRIVTYYGLFRDYIVKNNGSVSPSGAVKKYCEDKDIKLPMLSKNGKTISGWSISENKTIFYTLNDDGKCTPQLKIDFMVGKIDFDYKNKYAAFHASSHSTRGITENHTTQDEKGDVDLKNYINQQIFVMSLDTKKIHKLSFGSDNIYYPHFGENGFLYALKHDKNTKKFSLLEINVDEALKLADTEGSVCINCTEERQKSLFKIGCGH